MIYGTYVWIFMLWTQIRSHSDIYADPGKIVKVKTGLIHKPLSGDSKWQAQTQRPSTQVWTQGIRLQRHTWTQGWVLKMTET